jgi:hypothetical protein
MNNSTNITKCYSPDAKHQLESVLAVSKNEYLLTKPSSCHDTQFIDKNEISENVPIYSQQNQHFISHHQSVMNVLTPAQRTQLTVDLMARMALRILAQQQQTAQ